MENKEIRPNYYKHPSDVECVDITDHLSFNLGNYVKYVWRYRGKNGREDLTKAAFYLARWLDQTPVEWYADWKNFSAIKGLVEKVIFHERLSDERNEHLFRACCAIRSACKIKDFENALFHIKQEIELWETDRKRSCATGSSSKTMPTTKLWLTSE